MNNYRIKIFLSSAVSLLAAAAFIWRPSAVADGVRDGLSLCGEIIIPSLFPFFVLSDFLVRSGLCGVLGNIFSASSEKIFRLPGASACAVIMSFTGGFPVGAKMTCQLLEKGEITEEESRRMMLFCVGAGPAFMLGTVGAHMLSSVKAGFILYISLTSASLLTGFLLRFFAGERIKFKSKSEVTFTSGALTESVDAAVNSILCVSAWILLFSAVSGFVFSFDIQGTAKAGLSILTEVTNGCRQAAGLFPVPVIAFAAGWAGLAVHFQIFPYIKKTGVPVALFWVSRLVNGAAATALAELLFRLFPCNVSVFSAGNADFAEAFSVSAPASAAVTVLAAFFLYETELARKKHI